MKDWLTLILAIWLGGSLRAADDHEGSSALEWSGDGQLRLVVEVSRQAGERTGDLRPAEVVVDFLELLGDVAPKRLPDLATVRVIRHDTRTGKPLESAAFAFGHSPWDAPWRWYDDAIGYEFPEVVRAIDQTKDEPRYETRTRFGYFYGCIGALGQMSSMFSNGETLRTELCATETDCWAIFGALASRGDFRDCGNAVA